MSFPAYPDYKDSGIAWLGDMPSHWDASHLRWLSRRYSGGTPDKRNLDFWENGTIPWLGSGEVNQRTIVQPTTYITEDALAQSSAKWVPRGALVMALAGQGKTKGMVAQLALEATCNQSMAAIVPSDERYARFLFWWLEANYQNIRNMAGGDLRDGLNLELLGDIDCPLPPLFEQTGISAFLDRETEKIDALVVEQERLIALLREKRQAVISHAVTKGLNPDAPKKDSGIEWLGEIPAHWEILPLTRVVRQFVDYRGATPNKVDEGVPLLTAATIKEGVIDHSRDPVFISEAEYETRMTRGFPAKGDLLLTTEAPLGEAALIEDEHVAPGQRMILMKMEPAYMLSSYLLAHFRSQFGQAELWTRASGSTASGIRADRLRASLVAVPPLDEQQAIADYIVEQTKSFGAIEAEADTAITFLHERRAALISAAVTGKIDVRAQASQSNVISIGSARPSILPPLRAVVGAYAIRELGLMGRMAVMKAGYLAEGHAGFGDLCGRYERYAAGPYDHGLISAMERGAGEICAIVTNEPQDEGKPVTYEVPKRYQPPSDALSALVGEDRAKRFLAMLSLLKDIGRDGVEAVATLYAVWNDLLAAGKAADDDAICNGVLHDWHPEKAKKFKRANLDYWLDWMGRNDLVPDGSAPRTDNQGNLFA